MSQTSNTALSNPVNVWSFILFLANKIKIEKKLFLVSLKFLFPSLTMRKFWDHSGVLGTNWLLQEMKELTFIISVL